MYNDLDESEITMNFDQQRNKAVTEAHGGLFLDDNSNGGNLRNTEELIINNAISTKLRASNRNMSLDTAQMAVESHALLRRPMFRIQFKKWHHSNFGDYIEYEMVIQQLEGSRRAWVISKRYTDFVNLHEALIPYFKRQVETSRKSKLKISNTEQILPILP
jgi:hypothetical protein